MAESNINSENTAKGDGVAKVEGSHRDEQNTKTESKSVGTLRRFLSRRERLSGDSRQGWFFNLDRKRKKESEDVRKIQTITQRLSVEFGVTGLVEAQIEQALHGRFANGDVEKATMFLLAYEDAVDGVIREISPSKKLVGAENRGGVTCYIDALLFAMFARLDTFDAMLYNHVDDEPRRTLSILLRVWVNMLRSGMLITEDITQKLQETLSDCGWAEAGRLRQQDTSEAFTFISEKLGLPRLTFKVDIYHTGREEDTADHKFVNEQLLEVAVPSDPGNGQPIPLEIPLENYFNNQIEIKRYLQRRDPMDPEKAGFAHIESIDTASSGFCPSPLSQNPPSPLPLYTPSPLPPATCRRATSTATITEEPSSIDSIAIDDTASVASNGQTQPSTQPSTSQAPAASRNRAQSIIREVVVEEDVASGDNGTGLPRGRPRKSSIRKQVDMPAWQFFRLLPWYQSHGPTSDAQVAAHFASKRPTLGICLKRYGVDANGRLTRIDTRLDIPLEIRFPHFIQDEKPGNDGPLGNFKLVLQSVVCHRGKSLNGGHYIALVRGGSAGNKQMTSEERNSTDSRDGDREHGMWLKFDDLDSPDRVRLVNIKDALDNEMPYLLFYQIQPIDEELPPIYETGSSGSSTMIRLSEAEDAGVFKADANSTAVNGQIITLEGGGEIDTEEATNKSATSSLFVEVLREDDVVITSTKEGVSSLGGKLAIDKVQGTKEEKLKLKKNKGRDKSEGKAKAKEKGKVPDRQCVVM
ncbi:MAG: hypothetical protein M1840_008814 [Geoglossum simile]|nr:MAG: hypothetical protein M1840_008814 [Geoglossum simile]